MLEHLKREPEVFAVLVFLSICLQVFEPCNALEFVSKILGLA